jgi:hypothetical protein
LKLKKDETASSSSDNNNKQPTNQPTTLHTLCGEEDLSEGEERLLFDLVGLFGVQERHEDSNATILHNLQRTRLGPIRHRRQLTSQTREVGQT